MVRLLNVCIEKEQFINNCWCIHICDLCHTLVSTMYIYEFKLLVVVYFILQMSLVNRKGGEEITNKDFS